MLKIYRDIATGKEFPEKVVKNFIKTDKIGDEMYLSFLNDCLIKQTADFFDPIKKG